MKILVLGAASPASRAAYYLAKDGHEVTLVEAQAGVGRGGQRGQRGHVAPGHSFAWASPKAPAMLLRSLLGQETAIRVPSAARPRPPHLGRPFPPRVHDARAPDANTLVKLRLCQYSQALMTDLVRTEGIEYHAVTRGALYVYRGSARVRRRRPQDGAARGARAAPGGAGSRSGGAARASVRRVQEKIAGAVRDLGDTSGDSRLFTEKLARLCQEKLGVILRLGTRVSALQADGDRITGAVTSVGALTADAYVLALGVDAPLVARHDRRAPRDLSRQGLLVDLSAPGGRGGADRAGRRRAVARGPVRARATGSGSPRPRSSRGTTGAGPRATSTTSCASPGTSFRPRRIGSAGSSGRVFGQ